MKKLRFISLFLSLFIPSIVFANTEHDGLRREAILKALNSRPSEWIAPITTEAIFLKDGFGRVDVNPEVKFSYYIHTENPSDPKSKIILIPMATSRYAPAYYQSDDWWDAHKEEITRAREEGRPTPRQDHHEALAWLRKMKLSTNPLVFEINPENFEVKTQNLKKFLTDYYIKNYAVDGKIRLYRGGEKATETAEWKQGNRPRGARYWAPTASYAWRYASKHTDFLEKTIRGEAPIYVFEMSVNDFLKLTQEKYPMLNLGTELTKQVHTNFDKFGKFTDHLFGNNDYMGVGDIGLELEIRSNSKGANQMVSYFKGIISIEELAKDRVKLLEKTRARALLASPMNTKEIHINYDNRIEQTLIEGKILKALQNNMSLETVQNLSQKIKTVRFNELSNGAYNNFDSFLNKEMSKLRSNPLALEKEKVQLDLLFKTPAKSCNYIFQ